MKKITLCVNIDHVATLRQARGGSEPDIIKAATICEGNGAAGITVHLREDRRHIQDKDVITLKDVVKGKFNLEMALSNDVITVARRVIPDQITLVPEKREELTTEGGLDVGKNLKKIKEAVKIFHDLGCIISLFIEPERDTIDMTKESGADYIEIHTGSYCNAHGENNIRDEIEKIYQAAGYAVKQGIKVNAGHGLNIHNVVQVLKTPGLEELNIGHSIISRAVFLGLDKATGEMLAILDSYKD